MPEMSLEEASSLLHKTEAELAYQADWPKIHKLMEQKGFLIGYITAICEMRTLDKTAYLSPNSAE